MLSFITLVLLVISWSHAGFGFDLDILLQGADVIKDDSAFGPLQTARYTAGYLRTDYTDVGSEGKFFVQAEVLTIGVCYSSPALVTPGAPTREPTAPPTTLPGVQAAYQVDSDSNRHLRTVNPQQELGQYQKLCAVREDTAGQTFALYYKDYSDIGCTNEVNAFTVGQNFQGSATTSNNVLLKLDRRYIESEGLATAVPSFNNGYFIR